jgi:adenylate cyclase
MMRYLASGRGVIRDLDELRQPMADVLDYFIQQKKELERYRRKYGELNESDRADDEVDDDGDDNSDDDGDDDSDESDSEQE